jgi:FlaG/FlaF family flagellin (archaellin)
VVEKNFMILNDGGGTSPILGVVLMLLLTIVLAGVTVSAVYSDDLTTSLSSAPMSGIKAESEGSIGYHVGFAKNFIYLEHTGGEPLFIDSTKIIITGDGNSYTPVCIGGVGGYLNGDVFISYNNLLFDGKISAYASRNSALLDGVWSPGEKLILNGKDSIDGTSASSVSVSVNGNTNTSNNYGLKENSMITIKVFDIKTQRLISECECKVIPVE